VARRADERLSHEIPSGTRYWVRLRVAAAALPGGVEIGTSTHSCRARVCMTTTQLVSEARTYANQFKDNYGYPITAKVGPATDTATLAILSESVVLLPVLITADAASVTARLSVS